ncbi:MAG: glycosyltransferase [Prevotella sp.]|nr:glycosyltransferase [Prevotella sp.]
MDSTPLSKRRGAGGEAGAGAAPSPIRFFIGIQRGKEEYKGTDVMLRALERVAAEVPERCRIVKVESVPFEEYKRLLDGSDVLLDQLYSYTPAMNALEAMAHGIVVVSGGEPENYEILGETQLRPIVNVLPDEEDVYQKLRALADHPQDVARRKQESLEYIRRHHDHLKVAGEYLAFWQDLKPASELL